MAVKKNPYENWRSIRDNSDYRSRETQASALTRQILSQPEYLTSQNRVNPGPLRNTRASTADLLTEKPHDARNEDIWGWQPWAEKGYILEGSHLSSNLLEKDTVNPADNEVVSPIRVTLPSLMPVTIKPIVSAYVHEQFIESRVWTIRHNLGLYPGVELFNSLYQEIEGNVQHPSLTVTIITFSKPVSGAARLTYSTKVKVFNQLTPSLTWNINHGLGYYPSVELLNEDWNEVEGNVVHTSLNTIKIEFTVPIAGHARLV